MRRVVLPAPAPRYDGSLRVGINYRNLAAVEYAHDGQRPNGMRFAGAAFLAQHC